MSFYLRSGPALHCSSPTTAVKENTLTRVQCDLVRSQGFERWTSVGNVVTKRAQIEHMLPARTLVKRGPGVVKTTIE